jgi:hypothetical protein
MVVLPHGASFPVMSVSCYWVPVNFSSWVPVLLRPSPSGHMNSNGDLTSSGGSHVDSRSGVERTQECSPWIQRRFLFGLELYGSTSAHWVTTAFLS